MTHQSIRAQAKRSKNCRPRAETYCSCHRQRPGRAPCCHLTVGLLTGSPRAPHCPTHLVEVAKAQAAYRLLLPGRQLRFKSYGARLVNREAEGWRQWLGWQVGAWRCFAAACEQAVQSRIVGLAQQRCTCSIVAPSRPAQHTLSTPRGTVIMTASQRSTSPEAVTTSASPLAPSSRICKWKHESAGEGSEDGAKRRTTHAAAPAHTGQPCT